MQSMKTIVDHTCICSLQNLFTFSEAKKKKFEEPNVRPLHQLFISQAHCFDISITIFHLTTIIHKYLLTLEKQNNV